MTGPAQATVQGAAVVDGIDLDAVSAAVRSCPGVDDLISGPWGGVVSYLPGRRLAGVRVTGDQLLVSVRGRWGVPAGELGRQIRLALAALAGSRRIDVVLADMADDPVASADEVTPWTTSSGAGSGAPTSGTVIRTGAVTPQPSPPD